MHQCGDLYPCDGNCSCGCPHSIETFKAWVTAYFKGRNDAAEDIARMRDVDEACMQEIESDPDLNESYILIRRTEAVKVAKGQDNHPPAQEDVDYLHKAIQHLKEREQFLDISSDQFQSGFHNAIIELQLFTQMTKLGDY